MPHRKANFSVFLASRSILLCSIKCLSLASFFGMVYISASYVVSIFLSPENIIVRYFPNDNKKCSSNVVEQKSSTQTTDFTTIKMCKKKKQTENASICLIYYVFLGTLPWLYCFSKALEVDDLALAEEFYNVVDVGVVREAEDIIIGYARLLLGGEVLYEVAIRIALWGDCHRVKWHSCGAWGENSVSVSSA